VSLTAINPATGETIATHPETAPADLARRVEQSREAFLAWRDTGIAERARHLQGVAVLLRRDSEPLAALMAREMGKPIRQGRAEIEKCAHTCEHVARHAADWLAPETVPTEALRSYVAFRPLGILLAVMPWNFPFWQVFRAAAPALMAGNALLLKHASNVPGCALAAEALWHEAGLPEGVFRTMLVGANRVGDLIAHPHVAAVTLTGSTPAGMSVAALAGAALKKTVLELGGSDPYLVLEDADVPKAAALCATARLLNGGQSCIAAKRFIVANRVRAAFEEHLVRQMTQAVMGDPLLETTTLGPMARHDLREELHRQVARSVEQGARLLCGGRVPEGRGAFYPPTVLTEVRPGMAAWDEETFGPVAAIAGVDGEVEAIRLANGTVFGLGSAVFTRNHERGERIAGQLEAGVCFINDFVRSDPRLPFGGVKRSGYGRELSPFGIREFVNIQTVWVKEP
jgi:succinate-semialdehyde dehydrogenase/glutarate-semialdehyde dehydrogenase